MVCVRCLIVFVLLFQASAFAEIAIGDVSRSNADDSMVTWSDVKDVYELYNSEFEKFSIEFNKRNSELNRSGELPKDPGHALEKELATLRTISDPVELRKITAALKKRTSSPYEEGQLLYKHAERALLLGHPDAEELMQNALTYSIWPHQESDLYRLLGQRAIYTPSYSYNSEELAQARRLGATEYLKGLDIAHQSNRFSALPPLPIPNTLEKKVLDNPTADEIEEIKQQKEFQKEKMRVANALVEYDSIRRQWFELLQREVITIYSWKPYDVEEIENLANKYLDDQSLIQDILIQVHKNIQDEIAKELKEDIKNDPLTGVDDLLADSVAMAENSETVDRDVGSEAIKEDPISDSKSDNRLIVFVLLISICLTLIIVKTRRK